ncbi:hypothetical protein [Sphingomonas bacterium]|uniref:hypothetical protein n=1 Tax=Sphingomonas bacterium TaxID=1895847 RepID=UPI0020C61E99|nr:hypothetical protein [Sphingomonas bacterium]
MRRVRQEGRSGVFFARMKRRSDPSQSMQRVKVGMIGLAVVVLLIGLASAIIGSATRERPGLGTATSQAMASNATMANQTAATEPLAELGVAPMAGNGSAIGH